MPPVIYQTRFEATECDSNFAQDFNSQASNPLYNAPRNAPRNDSILRCRGAKIEGSNITHLGYRPVLIGNEARYTTFLNHGILQPMKKYDWIDDLTSEVTIMMLLYTPGLENLSLLRIRFVFSETGRAQSYCMIQTHTILRDRPDFTEWLALNCAFLALTLCRAFWVICGGHDRKRWKGAKLLDFNMAFLLSVYTIFAIHRRYNVKSLLDKITPLVNSFYAVTDTRSIQQIEQTMEKYFQVLDEVSAHVETEDTVQFVAYILILCSLAQLMCYMSVHPRIAVLIQTVRRAADGVFHFMIVFLMMFFVFAWLACWSFGPDRDMFASIMYAAIMCLQMLTGEFPFEPAWKVTLTQQIWYICYIFLVFFLAVSVFLAIIVDSFSTVKRETVDLDHTERNVLVDLISLLHRWLWAKVLGWPNHRALALHLEITQYDRGPVTSLELASSRCMNFRGRHEAQRLMDFYLRIVGEPLLTAKGADFVQRERQSKRVQGRVVKYFDVPRADVRRVTPSVVKIQRAWRRYHWVTLFDERTRLRRGTLNRNAISSSVEAEAPSFVLDNHMVITVGEQTSQSLPAAQQACLGSV